VATGRLLLIDGLIDQATATMRLKALFPNTDERLWPGAFVNAPSDLKRGTGRFNLAQGLVALCVGIGAGLSNLTSGFVVQYFGYPAGFLFLAGIAVGALVFFATLMPETKEDPNARTPAASGEAVLTARPPELNNVTEPQSPLRCDEGKKAGCHGASAPALDDPAGVRRRGRHLDQYGTARWSENGPEFPLDTTPEDGTWSKGNSAGASDWM
jgi:hypothetical protein